MKEENIKGEYQRKVDKSLIPTCNIMGVNIAAINMNWLLKYLDANLSDKSRFGFYRKCHQRKICGRPLLHFRSIHLKRQQDYRFDIN